MRTCLIAALIGFSVWAGCKGTEETTTGGNDAGVQIDSGSQIDAGAQTDAGASDAGVQADAGTSDAGMQADGGASDAGATKPMTFIADPGYRVALDGGGARQPAAGRDDAGTTYLYYETDNGIRVSTSSDGMTFSAGAVPTDYRYHHRYQLMPDGRWRTFMPSQDQKVMISVSTPDGANPTTDLGARYDGGPTDNAKFGIVEVFPDPVTTNKYIMIYLGDLAGKGNARRAVSTNGGDTFTFDRGNVLGDDACTQAQCRYVDQVSVPLATGERRMFAMKGGGSIETFISDANWDVFTQEADGGVTTGTFTGIGLTCYSLHDPAILRLPDGRHRMYVTCRVNNDAGTDRGAIVSATTAL